MKNFELSVLDLAPVKQGKTIHDTFQDSLSLANFAENLNYKRFWLAEHHNMESIASSATSVLIGFIANGTKKIRVGSGGIMLPNHSSLVIAEQFGTLESLFPGRIDLGLGRAPGTDGLTAQALGRNPMTINEQFPRQILELQTYFSKENSDAMVRAIPGEGLDIPLYILGSSTDSAWLAAELGLPYAFAGHFAPEQMEMAFKIYRQQFRPSRQLKQPYVIACVNGIAASTSEEARAISTTLYQAFINIIRNDRKPFAPPVKDMDDIWSPMEKSMVLQKLKYTLIGDQAEIEEQLQSFQEKFEVDELMVNAHIYDHQKRLESYHIFSEAKNSVLGV
ncbi:MULTISPECIES: LLM class flavin-dependent oxidoreductase [Chryseobacterium]|uniref:Luciferase family oxidoreductase group 1 n=1 Tax=Chryseobacterium camelliae TaxID=1265445 RepID=A0ABU0TMC3_9FLAO|nr:MULTISPECIES: LLM class flavin-dependent oxidoreductase [Chryseobacterium]MDT3408717.1 luciferase family oxidoreductase group 1 [Pseudacidovorax intermedius]MDQ1097430.1 luciferase family oxidoreductase group 1 [Chryseobacterium camelliae]MDQ1101358.1 luciferase family oxidoreductase group 1 [Chryseobacterium sp. SORGH_AS_1048]MDR6084803.1 luciferase family oxidoreductase group 1 [Chryseobacterium sp. SORGH_AS_0909]MDR6129150.1 luciferase family oxidoreductase group 1 [Chryseobacterium sp. 